MTQQGDEIKGTVEIGTDPAFTLEAILVIIEQFSKSSGVQESEIIKDLWRLNQMRYQK